MFSGIHYFKHVVYWTTYKKAPELAENESKIIILISYCYPVIGCNSQHIFSIVIIQEQSIQLFKVFFLVCVRWQWCFVPSDKVFLGFHIFTPLYDVFHSLKNGGKDN